MWSPVTPREQALPCIRTASGPAPMLSPERMAECLRGDATRLCFLPEETASEACNQACAVPDAFPDPGLTLRVRWSGGRDGLWPWR